MAFPSTSGVFVPTFVNSLNGVASLNLTSSTNVALYTNSVTGADLTTDTAYGTGAWGSNEVSGAGYTTGGTALASPTWAHTAGGIVMWDGADTVWLTSTIIARGALYYVVADSRAILAQTFGADIQTINGTFTIQYADTGILYIDCI